LTFLISAKLGKGTVSIDDIKRSEGEVSYVHTIKAYIGVQLHSLVMLTLDGGKWLTSCPNCLTPGRDPGEATELVWTFWRRKNLLPLPRFDSQIIRPVA